MKAMSYIMKIMQTALFILLTVLIIAGLACITENKESDGRLDGFFEEEKDIDVLLLGSSHIRHGIFPLDLFHDHGIVSYNLAGNGDTIPVSYWKLKMALEYQRPKLVVMDVYVLWPNAKTSENGIGQVHTSLDAFPLSAIKYEAAMDLFETKEKQMEILWPFSTYHTRWTSLTQTDFEVDYTSSLLKGSLPLFAVVERQVSTDRTPTEDLVYDEMSADYLARMIRLCQANSIKILLVNSGYDVNKTSQLFADKVHQIAQQYDVAYLDLVTESIIDYDTDLDSSGQNTHVNSSGALKLTDYLGNYIIANYDIPNKAYDERYKDWASDYQKYVEYKIRNISDQTTMVSQLMLLADDDFSTLLYVNDGKRLIGNERIYHLIQNLTGGGQLQCVDEIGNSGEKYCLVVDNEGGQVSERIGNGFGLETSFGDIIFRIENNIPALYIHDMSTNQFDLEWLDIDSAVGEPDVQVFAINNYNHKIVSYTKWYYTEAGTLTRR